MDQLVTTLRPLSRMFEDVVSEPSSCEIIKKLLPNIKSGWSRAVTENNWGTREITIWSVGIATTAVALIALGIVIYNRIPTPQDTLRQEVLTQVAIGPITDQTALDSIRTKWRGNDGATHTDSTKVQEWFTDCEALIKATAATDIEKALNKLKTRYTDTAVQKEFVVPAWKQFFETYDLENLTLNAALFDSLQAAFNDYQTHTLTPEETQSMYEFAYTVVSAAIKADSGATKDHITFFEGCCAPDWKDRLATTLESKCTPQAFSSMEAFDFSAVEYELRTYSAYISSLTEVRPNQLNMNAILTTLLDMKFINASRSATPERILALIALGSKDFSTPAAVNAWLSQEERKATPASASEASPSSPPPLVSLIFKQTNLNGEDLRKSAIVNVRWEGGEQAIKDRIKGLIVRGGDTRRIRLYSLSTEGSQHGTRTLTALSIDPSNQQEWLKANRHNLWYTIEPITEVAETQEAAAVKTKDISIKRMASKETANVSITFGVTTVAALKISIAEKLGKDSKLIVITIDTNIPADADIIHESASKGLAYSVSAEVRPKARKTKLKPLKITGPTGEITLKPPAEGFKGSKIKAEIAAMDNVDASQISLFYGDGDVQTEFEDEDITVALRTKQWSYSITQT